MTKSRKSSVAIIDDSRMKRMFLAEVLKEEFDVHPFSSGEEALPALPDVAPACILLDVEMPRENGFQVLERIKGNPRLSDIPVIFVTSSNDHELERRGLECGGVDFVSNQFSPEIIRARVRHHVDLYGYRCHLEERVQESMMTILELQDALIVALSDLVECRDSNTAGHAQRAHNYVERLIGQMVADGHYVDELTEDYIHDIIRASPLHDIGKVGVSDAVLNKPDGHMTEAEFAEMKRHTIFGATAINKAMRSVSDKSFLGVLRDLAFSHHEKWNGTGYPLGLKERSIPLCGRIMAVADAYDSLVSRRPDGTEPVPHEKAVQLIREGAGLDFDPLICDAFMRCADDFRSIAQSHND